MLGSDDLAMLRGIRHQTDVEVQQLDQTAAEYRNAIAALQDEIAALDRRLAEEVCIVTGLHAYAKALRTTARNCVPLKPNGRFGPNGEVLCDALEAYNRAYDNKAVDFGRPDLIDLRVEEQAGAA